MYQAKVLFTSFIESVLHLAEQRNADFIGMGNTGLTGLQCVISGSNTQQIIKRTNKPWPIIPKDFRFKGFVTKHYLRNQAAAL
ncbi:universal stress protein [Pontibacter qinzhouensis]|uniref:Universal stress protein n=1 Tax=Pontibacter qinzhouensis TaxID=2603253 RepID=A0A5C8KDN1_9BACT|nr:universal stress protein [Pontibacter qinzhouensis]TXK52837.1 universal stress protein [Pontibacter qinzhouensis]